MSADTSILPSELLVTPLPLIGFAGLDVAKNPVHKMIWESFSINKKNDRALVQYKLLPPNYEFPVSKPKRQSYEWYHPKGILKKNWLLKHQHVLPAVVVLFQDMDWNDMQWSEHQLRCASAVQGLKNALQGQSTKIAIALLQRATQQQAGEEQLAHERTAALASTCDINPKLIFLFPYNEHLVGYTYRLEASFLELAQSYYTQMAKQIRMHRDQLTDMAHLALRIRHQFKLAVIAEFRQDHAAALKNYAQAYAQLDEVRIVDANCLEVKTIAGFLNYKICRLMFRSVPRDSIVHFKSHIERFRSRTGYREIAFEHYAWLSLQYSAFAELFCDAIKQGLPALQTQHPGIYYHKAAEHMGRRKELFRECSATAAGNSTPAAAGDANASYANQFYSEFFGVRTTKIGDAATEQHQFALVLANERNFNHSVATIALLGQAMAQFKIYRCLRFRKKLAVDMAEEYLQCGDHSKALTLYSLMLTDYRTDRWYGVFTQVLLKTLQAARLSASVVDFLTCSIEAMSPRIAIDRAQRVAIMDNFWRVVQNSPPVGDSTDAAAQQSTIWSAALQKLQHKTPGAPVAVVDLDKLTELFECTLTFREPQVRYDEPLHVDLFIRTRSELSFKLSTVRAVLADSTLQFTLPAKRWTAVPARKQLHTVGDEDADNESLRWSSLGVAASDDILLQSNVCYKFAFVEADFKFPENEELRIVRLEMTVTMGTHTVLLTQSATLNARAPFRRYDAGGQSMDTLPVHRTCYVVPTFHLNTQTTHADGRQQPMLTNEYFRTEQVISNTFDVALQTVGLSVTVPAALKNSVFLCTDVGKSTQRLQSALHFDLGDVAPHATTSVAYYVVALCEGNIDLRQKVWYQLPERAHSEQHPNVFMSAGSLTVESPVHKASGGSGSVAGAASATSSAAAAAAVASTTARSQQHNMSIERLPDGAGVRKCREDVIIVPCVEEVSLRARFFTLNKQPLRRAYCDEDVLLRVDVEVQAPCAIDVLEMFFISDHNIAENAQHQKQQRKQFAGGCTRGHKLRDVKMLRAHATSAHWQRHPDDKSGTPSAPAIDWKRRGSAARLTATGAEFHTLCDVPAATAASAVVGGTGATATSGQRDSGTAADKYKSNLLSKIPANSTIIGSTGSMSSNLMNRSLTDSSPAGDGFGSATTTMIAASTIATTAITVAAAATTTSTTTMTPTPSTTAGGRAAVKHVFNRTVDAFVLTDHCRGFLRDRALPTDSAASPWPVWGVYCVRWRRSGDPNEAENESKFVVQGIEVVDPPLNIYCYLDERMYVKVPMTLTVAIRNPTRYAMHLRTCLKNSEHFMFSGNTQLNVSIFARSTFELSFNLYPLMAGWQRLPEFEVTYNTQYDENSAIATGPTAAAGAPMGGEIAAAAVAAEVNQELHQLTQRWMPKKVFVLPMLKHCQAS